MVTVAHRVHLLLHTHGCSYNNNVSCWVLCVFTTRFEYHLREAQTASLLWQRAPANWSVVSYRHLRLFRCV